MNDHSPDLDFERKPILFAIPVAIAALILFSPVLFSGNVLFWGTPSLQFVPWRAWAWDQITQGILPLWNPLVGMGAPLAANYQSALFYPPTWLLWLFQALWGDPGLAWGQTWLVVLHLAWSGLGASLVARLFKVSILGQVVSGLAFGLSGYLVARAGFFSINAAAAWLPWVFLYGEKLRLGLNSPSRGRFENIRLSLVPFIGCVGMQLLAGHAQTTWYSLLLTGLWAPVMALKENGWRTATRTILWLVGGITAGFLLAGVQILPTLEYLGMSQRASEVGYEYAANFSFWPWHFLNLVAPRMFGSPVDGTYWFNAYYYEDAVYLGLAPLILAGLALLHRQGKGSPATIGVGYDRRFLKGALSAIVIFTFLIALGRYTPVYSWLYHNVPTFDMFQAPTRWTILAVFALSILAGLGVDDWRRPTGKGLYWSRLGTAGAFAITLGAGLAAVFFQNMRATFLPATALMGFWAMLVGILSLTIPTETTSRQKGRIWRASVIAVVCLDLILAGWGLNPGTKAGLYGPTPGEVAEIKERIDGARIYMSLEDEETIKYDWFFRVKDFSPVDQSLDLRKSLLANLNMLDDISSVNNYEPILPARYTRWMEWLDEQPSDGVPAWLEWMGVGAWIQPDLSMDQGRQITAVNPQSRYRWVGCPSYVSDPEEAWKLLTQRPHDLISGESLVERAVIETGDVKVCAAEGLKPATIRIIQETSQSAALEISTQDPGWLIQADTWYPGWVAFLDGQAVAIEHAEYIFRGIYVPVGDHQVTLEYKPTSFLTGLVCSLVMLGLLIGIRRIKK